MNSETASTRECKPPAARAALKRPSENSGEEPPRVKCHVSIIASGEDVLRTDKCESSPLHYAAREGDVEKVKKLIESGADVRLRNRQGETPLHCALIWEKEAAAELLAEADSSNDIEDDDRMTPLLYAAQEGYVKTIGKLLAGGARTRVQGTWGRTPLHRAVFWKKEAAAELLAEADSSNDIEDIKGMTPLLYAAEEGYVKTIKKLLAGGARTRVQGLSGGTPLLRALNWNKEAAAKVLAEADSGNDIKDCDGMTPLHLAAEKGFQRVVKKFVQSGTNPHVQNGSGNYPIQLALKRRGNECILKMLLSMYALKGIGIDWEELQLGKNHLQFCVEEFSRCDAEIQLMKHTQVPASSISHFALVTRHVGWVTSRLRIKSVRGILRSDPVRRNFPVYADLIVFKLRMAEARRVWRDRCLECFSFLSPPLPTTCTDVVLLCLSDSDMVNFVRALQLNS